MGYVALVENIDVDKFLVRVEIGDQLVGDFGEIPFI
jgi:hypothetical protein